MEAAPAMRTLWLWRWEDAISSSSMAAFALGCAAREETAGF